jgi:predicted nucleic acid-binding protein
VGLRETLRGKRVYFDANVFIYLLEGYAELEDKLHAIRDSIRHRECRVFTSELTLCELLVPAFRTENAELIAAYRQFIEASGAFELVPTTREIWLRSSLIRAQFNLKTPDAIHIASAMTENCTVFLTNDRPIKSPRSIEIVLLDS